jgi:hypothetical protein
MSPNVTLQTQRSIADLLKELSFDDLQAADETASAENVAAANLTDDFSSMQVEPLNLAQEESAFAETATPTAISVRSESFNVAKKAAQSSWQIFLDAMIGKTQPFLPVEKSAVAAETVAQTSVTRALKPAQWNWSELLDCLAGRKITVSIPEKLPVAVRWQSKATRTPGLSVAELAAEIDA